MTINNNYGEYRNRQFSKLNTTKLVKLLCLHFLIKKSYYGNELSDIIEKTLNYKWKPSNGMLYPLLRNMEENQWVKGWWDEPDKKNKRHYKITDEGIKHYNKIKLIYKPILEEAIEINKCILNEVYNK